MRNTFVQALLEAAGDREDFLVISGDAGLGVFDDFSREHPDRFINGGIAEQNTISMAAGMALAGLRVCVYNIVPFLLYRAHEQVRNDICNHRLPVILAGIGAGLSYAPAGMTHYAIEDLAVARSLPGLEVLSPCDPREASAAARRALESSGPVYVRLGKRGEPELNASSSIDLTLPQVLREGRDCDLLVHGALAAEVLGAAEILSARGIEARVVSVPLVQPLDVDPLFPHEPGERSVYVIEEHQVASGLGAEIARQVALRRLPLRLRVLGLPAGSVHHVRDHAGMRREFGLDADSIARTVLEDPEVPGLSMSTARSLKEHPRA